MQCLYPKINDIYFYDYFWMKKKKIRIKCDYTKKDCSKNYQFQLKGNTFQFLMKEVGYRKPNITLIWFLSS